MIRFEFMDKGRKDHYLPLLFDILYANMKELLPSGFYDSEKAAWLSEVAPAVEKAPRQIILMYASDVLAGYFQYYVNSGKFMVEEIQIAPQFQGTTLLYGLFRFLGKVLPENTETIEAYVHKGNLRSRTIIRKLGMEEISEDGDYYFCRGNFRSVGDKFRKSK